MLMKKMSVILIAGIVSALVLFVTGCNSPVSETSAVKRVGTPQFGLLQGQYFGSQTITISTTTAGANIRYTTDGTDPTQSTGLLYNGEITIDKTTQIKAAAFKSGLRSSEVSEAVYSIIIWKGALATAPASPVGGWAYYNSTEGISYIYDGTVWQILAKDGQDGSDGEDNTAYMYIVFFNSYGATIPSSYSMKVLRSPTNTVGDLPSPPVKTYYTFDGWFTEINGGGDQFTGSTVVSGDIEVYAKWTAVEYSITYTLNGGSATNPGNYTVDANTFTLTNPTRTGYTFVGWSGTDLTGTTNTDVSISKGSTGNRSYTANWIINQYTVTYSSTGHTAGTVPSVQTQNYNTTITVSNGNLRGAVIVTSKVWQRFTGWNTASNGSGTSYQPGATFTLTANVILYAQYTTGTSVLRKQGPAGGWVFYDHGSQAGWGRYLEAWTADESSTYLWKTSNTSTAGTSTAIGTGYANTYTYMTGTAHPAANVARSATHGGFNDWFLPSKNELYEMCWVLHSRKWNGSASEDNPAYGTNRVGGFANGNYWSSSETNSYSAWYQSFNDGGQDYISKDSSRRVRAVRAF